MSFNVTILGSSGAVPAYGRYPSSQLIEIKNHYMLIDCGEGAQMQLMRYDCPLHRINHIFISHLHGDHFLGLMGLLFTMHLNHRTTDLHIYSHRGLDEIITTQLRYSVSSPRFRIVMHTLTPGRQEVIFDSRHFVVESIPLVHKIDCSGFLFREKEKPRRIDKNVLPPDLSNAQLVALKKGEDVFDENDKLLYKNRELTLPPRKSRAYAYCSDTAFDSSLASRIRGVDLLYHEATFMEAEKDKAVDTLHSTAAEAAKLATLAGVRTLLIGHFSARYKTLDTLLDEAKAVFSNTRLAIEGETITLPE